MIRLHHADAPRDNPRTYGRSGRARFRDCIGLIDVVEYRLIHEDDWDPSDLPGDPDRWVWLPMRGFGAVLALSLLRNAPPEPRLCEQAPGGLS